MQFKKENEPFPIHHKKEKFPKEYRKIYIQVAVEKPQENPRERCVCVCECMCECVFPSSRPRTIPFKWQESEKSTYQFSKSISLSICIADDSPEVELFSSRTYLCRSLQRQESICAASLLEQFQDFSLYFRTFHCRRYKLLPQSSPNPPSFCFCLRSQHSHSDSLESVCSPLFVQSAFLSDMPLQQCFLRGSVKATSIKEESGSWTSTNEEEKSVLVTNNCSDT